MPNAGSLSDRWEHFSLLELTKIIMIIVVTAFLMRHEDDLNKPKTLGKLILICAPPLYMILQQPNLSTTLDICFIVVAMVFVAGLDSKLIVRVVAVGVPLLAVFLWYVQQPYQILLKNHQVERIMSFLHPEDYANSTALQTNNSVMAIGSGGLFGKGFGSNTISDVSSSDVNLVSEQQTDFIFSVVGEEFGFVGCVIVIIVLLVLVMQCIQIARKADNREAHVSCDWNCQLYGISVFYQYRRCDRRYAEYGASASVYQLWLKFRFVGVHMYRTAVKY